MSELKQLLTKWQDLPYRKTATEIVDCRAIANRYSTADESVIFIHCREPEEIERFVKEYDAETLYILRDAVENEPDSNSSDAAVSDIGYDCIVENNGTLSDLKTAARTYLTEVLGLTI